MLLRASIARPSSRAATAIIFRSFQRSPKYYDNVTSMRAFSASRVNGSDDLNGSSSRQEEVRRATRERMAGRRRFYKSVGVIAIPQESDGESNVEDLDSVDSPISAGVDGTDSGSGIVRPSGVPSMKSSESGVIFGVTLDDRRIKTPAGLSFAIPSEMLAMAIAAEWENQTKYINPAQMPLMTLTCTAIDQTAFDPETVIQNILQYLPNDTTSYLVDPVEDRILARLQEKHWDALRTWSASVLGDIPATSKSVITFRKTKGLPHSDTVYSKAEEFVRSLDIWALTAMQCVTVEAKSFLVGLGVIKNFLNAEQAIGAARVEEEFQISNWGCVEGGHDYDRLNCSIQMRSAVFLLATTRK